MTDGEDLKAFLDNVLQAKDSPDVSWRNFGRWFGLYFLGALDAGCEPEQALQITATYQAAIIRTYQQQPPQQVQP